MKKIEAIIRSEKVRDAIDALRLAGVGGVTITEVKGFGIETARPEGYLILPKTKIDIYAGDDQVEELINAIVSVCDSNTAGDGKIVVLPIEDAVRVRTKERKEKALY